MEPIDVSTLAPLPAPLWFIQFFKVLGFSLHMIPMNLWYAGVLLAVGLHTFGGEHGRRLGSRLMLQMPIIIALGINFGIVPLLFLQLAYAEAFYPATILMAWFWLGIIALLIPAYYGVYLYSFGVREGGTMTPVKRAAGWIAALFFLSIGFIFANGLSLTANSGAWLAILENHNVAAAPTGTALNTADPSLWPRWLMMFGFALITTSVWIVVDAFWLAKQESSEYKRWSQVFAMRLALVGVVWAMLTGGHYMFGTWSAEVRGAMLSFPALLLTGITALSPWFAPALMWLWRKRELSRVQAAAIAGAQVGMVALNAISRQIVQNVEVGKLLDVSAFRVQPQWGPMAMFLAAFVAGVGCLVWILVHLLKVSAEPTTDV
jgi:hypothetical protein